MKHTLRCRDFGWGRAARIAASGMISRWVRCGQYRASPQRGAAIIAGVHRTVVLARSCPAPGGRWNVEQGPRLWGCDRGTGRERVVSGPMRVFGVRLLPAGASWGGAVVWRPGQMCVEAALSAPSRTTLRETESGAHPQRGPSSALRRAIQAHTAWNLLRPPRDLCREACQYSEYGLHLASRYRRFCLAPHARFIMLGALSGKTA